MAMTKVKTTKLVKLVALLEAEMTAAGDGASNKMPGLAGEIETILLSEALLPELTPFNPEPGEAENRCFIRKWYDADGEEVAESRDVALIQCRCKSALIAAAHLLPKVAEKKRGPGRPPADKA